MPRELDYQSKLIEDLKELGGWGYKTDHKHMAGLPDLVLVHPETRAMFLEVKITGPSGIVLLSPIQMATMKKMKERGAPIGVVAIRPVFGTHDYEVWATPMVDQIRVNENYKKFDKLKGEKWPILQVMRHCVS